MQLINSCLHYMKTKNNTDISFFQNILNISGNTVD